MSTQRWITAFTALALTTLGASCELLVCGDDTIERDGVCVAADLTPDEGTCGQGTHLENGECVPTHPTTWCDETTTIEDVTPEGDILCVGVGGGASCASPLPCSQPEAGKMRVCGRLFDIETNEPIEAEEPTTLRCTEVAEDGPCSLQLKYYDALGFANNPTAAQPIPTDEDAPRGSPPIEISHIDDCGRFIATVSVSGAPSGFLGIGVTDADDAPVGVDNWALTGVALPTTNRIAGFRAYAMRRATDVKWTESAELGGDSFAVRGTFVPIFLHQGQRTAGVTIRREGSADADNDFYFDDENPEIISNIAPAQAVTGVNGAGAFIRRGLVNFDGVGGLPDGCTWPSQLAGVIAGVVFVQEKVSVCP
jgi:hypothetical protein